MKKVLLKLKDNQLKPGNKLIAGVQWHLTKPPKLLEARLFWSTSGRGDKDLQIVDKKIFTPTTQGKEKFFFILPDGPYSFSGKLITLAWGVDFVNEKGKALAAEEFKLSPIGLELQL